MLVSRGLPGRLRRDGRPGRGDCPVQVTGGVGQTVTSSRRTTVT